MPQARSYSVHAYTAELKGVMYVLQKWRLFDIIFLYSSKYLLNLHNYVDTKI